MIANKNKEISKLETGRKRRWKGTSGVEFLRLSRPEGGCRTIRDNDMLLGWPCMAFLQSFIIYLPETFTQADGQLHVYLHI